MPAPLVKFQAQCAAAKALANRLRTLRADLARFLQQHTANAFSGVTLRTITGATNATPIVITSTAHGFTNGQLVYVERVGGNTAANGRRLVANVAANTFELQDPTTGLNVAGNGAYTSGGRVYPDWLRLDDSDNVKGQDYAPADYLGLANLAVQFENLMANVAVVTSTYGTTLEKIADPTEDI